MPVQRKYLAMKTGSCRYQLKSAAKWRHPATGCNQIWLRRREKESCLCGEGLEMRRGCQLRQSHGWRGVKCWLTIGETARNQRYLAKAKVLRR